MAGADTGILELPYQASSAIVGNRFVKLSGDQTVQQTGAGERALGVARVSISSAEATKGKGTAVHVLGVVFVEAGAVIARDANVTSDATGRAITSAAGNAVNGKAMKAAAAAGEKIPVLLAGGFGPTT